MKLLSLSGDNSSARGFKGPHYEMLKEFHCYWDRIDIFVPFHEEAKDITLFDNVHFHICPPNKWTRLSYLQSNALKLLNRIKHDLISAHDYPPFINGFTARYLSHQTAVPHVLEIYHIEGHPWAANLNERLRKFATAQYIKQVWPEAKAIRVINKTQVPQWLMAQGVPEHKLLLLYSSYTDLEVFKPRERKKIYDIIYVGRLVSNKGLDDILKAAQAIPELRVCFAGTGPLEKQLKVMTQKMNLDSRVYLTGWVKDSKAIAELINQSKALVCSSRSEGGPRTTIEAMACGLPVITTPVGTMGDIIQHQHNGLLIDPTSESLTAAIRWLLAHPKTAQKMGEAARQTAQVFEKKNLIHEYALGYQALVKNK